MNRDMLTKRLTRRGMDVVVAASGEEALVRLGAQPLPDLVLMDVGLPGIDGLEVTRRLKAAPATARLPVLVLTAHAMPEDQQLARAAGCDDFDTKPVDFARLVEKIEALLGRAGGA